MLYGLYWQDLFPWPPNVNETREALCPVTGDFIAEVLDLQPGQVLPYCFECLEGGCLEFTVSSSNPFDMVLCTGDVFEMWADLDFDDTPVSALQSRKGIRSASLSIRIPATDEYVMVLVNNHDIPAPILVFARPNDPPAARPR